MKIAHVAPFAPGRCGLYETVRDLVLGERRLGHDVELIDAGISGEGPHYGQTDGDLIAAPPPAARGADVLVTHTAPSPEILAAAGGAPVVHVLHGRPESSFRLSQAGGESPVYDVYAGWVKSKAVARWVTLWPEHVPYWSAILPRDRLTSLSAPPCDLSRWSTEGPKHRWASPGLHNVLLADPWRAETDLDAYHLLHGLLLAAERECPGLRVHVYGMRNPLGPWEHLLGALRRAGALGETCGMMREIATRYRAADVVLTPHRIATRVVREAAACGATVVTGERAARWGSYGCDPLDAESVAETVTRALRFPRSPDVARYDHVHVAGELVAELEVALGREVARVR